MIPKPQDLNHEEVLIGAVVGAILMIKLPTILVPALMAYFWAAGGAKAEDGGNKLYRRVGCSLTPCIIAFLKYKVWTVFLAFPLAFAVLSIGYGIPSLQPPDEGSTLGKFWYRISEEHANVLTRLTVYVLLAIAFIPIFIQ